jgi:hypothetical protein
MWIAMVWIIVSLVVTKRIIDVTDRDRLAQSSKQLPTLSLT